MLEGVLSKLSMRLRQLVNQFSSDSVLIYQMGKVGSTSLEESLSDALHVHTLYGNPPCKFHKRRWKKHPVALLKKLIGDLLKRSLIRRRKHVKIISLVREPYSRNVSMFFQDLPYWMVHYQEAYDYDSRKEGAEFLHKTFEQVYDHFYFDRWFDDELKRLTGIDVFSYPFDKELGYKILREGRYEVLLVKLEKLQEAHQAIEAFMGYSFEMKETNKSERKWYACIYREFKRTFHPSETYLASLYATKTVRHFYSDGEIDGFKKKFSVPRP